jgi:hypothetical protein
MANLTWVEALETVVDWNDELRVKFQDFVRSSEHDFVCGLPGSLDLLMGKVKYPELTSVYEPEDPCDADNSSASSLTTIRSTQLIFLFVVILISASVSLNAI